MNKQKSTPCGNIIDKEQNKQPSGSSKDANPRRQHLNNSSGQNVLFVWLDNNIDPEHIDEWRNTFTRLRRMADRVNKFTDCDQCVDFITAIDKEKVFMILSGELNQHIIPLIHDITQLDSIYILCGNKKYHEQCVKEWPKIKGVFTDVTPICKVLHEAEQECEHYTIDISFMSTNAIDASNKNLDQQDCSFMYTQILKEILLTIQFEEQHIKQFIKYCREVFVDNNYKLDKVNNFEREYRNATPIWWYTSDSFLYSMLNRALRTMNVDIIIHMGFFIRELHLHLEQLHSEQFGGHQSPQELTVYRGQSLSQTDFDQLMKTDGGLISFNSFLSTSIDRDMSLTFARKDLDNPDTVGILFVMTVDPSISSTPFASINDVSCFQEDEVLFSMHTVFRIRDIKQMDETNRLWQVNLILTSDNDKELRTLTERIRGETYPNSKGWNRLGILLLTMGQSQKAQQVYEVMLEQTTDDHEKANIYNLLIWAKRGQGEYKEALTYYEKVLEIDKKTLPANHPDSAASYNNIGVVYNDMGEYSKGLTYFEKALEIRQKSLSANHPDLASSYNNIGTVYDKMGEYSKALSYYEKALEIRQKSLSANHPDLASSYNNIGTVYDKMGEYSKALSYYEKDLEISQKSLPSNHPHLAKSYNNMREYPKALSSYEKALEIGQKSLPANHPDLGASYNNIGAVYNDMGEYSKALSYYEKYLEISQKSLPANHPDLASSY